MQAGPLLNFETLPRMFSEIPAGRFIGMAFLIGLWMLAFLSTIAAFQVMVAGLTDSFNVSLTKAVLIVGCVEALLMLPSALSPSIIGRLDLIFGSGMQMLGSGLAIIALLWGCDKAVDATQIFSGKTGGFRNIYLLWLKWIVPATLGVMLILYIAIRLADAVNSLRRGVSSEVRDPITLRKELEGELIDETDSPNTYRLKRLPSTREAPASSTAMIMRWSHNQRNN